MKTMKTIKRKNKGADWQNIGDTIYAILSAAYVDDHQGFKREAAWRKITVEQLATSAIVGMLQAEFDSETGASN